MSRPPRARSASRCITHPLTPSSPSTTSARGTFAVSLGGVESILSYPARMSHASMPPQERAIRGISDSLVRLSVGLEAPEDLIEELDRLING